MGANVAKLSVDGRVHPLVTTPGTCEYPKSSLSPRDKVLGVEFGALDVLPLVLRFASRGVRDLWLTVAPEMALLNRATMARSTPCADLASGLRSWIAWNRSTVH